jgi:hypothetical protein
MTSWGIEPATFRLVSCCVNTLRYRVLHEHEQLLELLFNGESGGGSFLKKLGKFYRFYDFTSKKNLSSPLLCFSIYLSIFTGVSDFIHHPDFNNYKKKEQTRRFGNWISFRPQVTDDG